MLPYLCGALLLGATIQILLMVWRVCMRQSEGHFTYVLDDPYIHMSIARNLAEHGVWGVTQYAWSSASSSPLWTALLGALVQIEGDSVFLPLALCVLFSISTAVLLYVRFLKASFPAIVAAGAAFAVFAAGPLHVLPFTGMEHCLQVLLDLVFGFWILDNLGRRSSAKDCAMALVLTMLVCSIRYEGAFLVVVPFFLSLWRRDWKLAASLAAGPILAIGGFAAYSHLMGMPLIPNSIAIKGHMPAFGPLRYIQDLAMMAFSALHFSTGTHADLFAMTLLSVLAMRLKALRTETSTLQIWMWTVVVACVLHAGFASFGWFFRYEAYLVVSMTTVMFLAVREVVRAHVDREDAPVSVVMWLGGIACVTIVQGIMNRIGWAYRVESNLILSTNVLALALLGVMIFGPRTKGRLIRSATALLVTSAILISIWDRAVYAYAVVGLGARDIYLQQSQMGRFVHKYYQNGRLAANDIGAVTYFSDVHLLDVWGLANDEVRRLRVARKYNTRELGRILGSFSPDLVIIYPEWYAGRTRLPDTYIPVARWIVPQTISSAFPDVVFFAPNAVKALLLRRQLREFQTTLPRRVQVQYFRQPVVQTP